MQTTMSPACRQNRVVRPIACSRRLTTEGGFDAGSGRSCGWRTTPNGVYRGVYEWDGPRDGRELCADASAGAGAVRPSR